MTGELPGPAPAERPQPTGRRDARGARIEPAGNSGGDRKRAVLSALVRHEPGVLAEVAGLFARRQFNIESLSVGPIQRADRARITLVVEEPARGVEQARKQLAKQVPIVSVEELDESAVERELALVSVDGDPAAVRAVAETYGGTTADATGDAMTVEVTGTEAEVDAAIEAFGRFGDPEIARTGTAALARDGEEP